MHDGTLTETTAGVLTWKIQRPDLAHAPDDADTLSGAPNDTRSHVPDEHDIEGDDR